MLLGMYLLLQIVNNAKNLKTHNEMSGYTPFQVKVNFSKLNYKNTFLLFYRKRAFVVTQIFEFAM